MTRHSISEFPLRPDSHLPWHRILLVLLSLGLLFAATRAVAAPPVAEGPSPAQSPR